MELYLALLDIILTLNVTNRVLEFWRDLEILLNVGECEDGRGCVEISCTVSH